MTRAERLCRLHPGAAACTTHVSALRGRPPPPPPAGRRHGGTLIDPDTALEGGQTCNAPELLLHSSQRLTPVLHLGLLDKAVSVTLDQVGSVLPASPTAEPFYSLLLWIKLYGDCQSLFDLPLRCTGAPHERFPPSRLAKQPFSNENQRWESEARRYPLGKVKTEDIVENSLKRLKMMGKMVRAYKVLICPITLQCNELFFKPLPFFILFILFARPFTQS